ncbi:MAG: phage portal protein [Anaerolineae bacterium]
MSSNPGIVIGPEWLKALEHADKITGVPDAYARVPLVFRAARLRANSLRRVPIHIERNGTRAETWDIPDENGRVIQPKELIFKTEMGLLLSGGGFWLHLRNQYKIEKGLQWLNPFSMQIIYVNRERRFYQVLNGYMTEAVEQYPKTAQGYWTDEEMHFWREYHPTDDVRFGVSAAANALQDARLLFYLTRMASTFFETGAMPAAIVPLPPGTDAETEKKINDWFKRALTGVRNAFRILALRTGPNGLLQPVVFSPDLKKYETPELRDDAVDGIAWAFDVPKTLLTAGSANRATADNEFRHYLTQTIVPRAEWYQDDMNRFLAEAGSPYRVIFAPDEITELQEDEQQRAQSYAFYVGAGMPHEVTAAILGIDVPSNAQAAWDAFLQKQRAQADKPPAPPTAIQPAAEPGKPPARAEGAPANGAQADEKPVATGPAQTAKAARFADLDKWERKALKRLSAGRNPGCDFESDSISAEMVATLQTRLASATEPDQVKAIFQEARGSDTPTPFRGQGGPGAERLALYRRRLAGLSAGHAAAAAPGVGPG